MIKTEQEIYDAAIKIAKNDERIRGVYVHGSYANPNIVKDKYSDYDIVFVVTEIDSLVDNNDWLNDFGDISFVFEGHRNENIFFGKEINDLSRFYFWGLLFKDGSQIDLLAEIKEEAMQSKFTANKRTIVLLDKDNCLPTMPCYENPIIDKPTEDKYTACCGGFWWFLSDVVKAIARDQLPYAMEKYNFLIRPTLNKMIDWHIEIKTDFSTTGEDNGRHYKKHLSEDFYSLYMKTYSDCGYENFWNAIFTACELFSKVAPEVGDYFGFAYNKQNETTMMAYLTKIKESMQKERM